MIIVFFILNLFIFLGVSLAVSMFDNHLKNISNSIDIFLDPKAYKAKSQMQFISSLVDKCKDYKNELAMRDGIDTLINECFYNQKIGVFNLSIIYTIASKGKQLLWANIVLMVLFESVTIGLGESLPHAILIVLSGGLGLILIFSQLYKNIDLEKQKLLIKIRNYLNYTYPYLKSKQKEEKQVSKLINKISQLEDEIERFEQMTQDGGKKEKLDLVEDDIIQLIEHFI